MIRASLAGLTLILNIFPISAGEPNPKVSPASVPMNQIKRLLDNSDSCAAAEWIEAQGAPDEVIELYHQAAQWLYNEHKDVPGMIALSQSGISFGLHEARRVAAENPELAAKLKGTAKAISFNLGSNTWPGWNDAGIFLTHSDLRVGLDAARLNLRLAVELQRGDEPLANARWLLGAHELAQGRYAAADEQFGAAARHAAAAGKGDMELMLQGYRALADLLGEPSAVTGRQEFEARTSALQKSVSDDGKFYAEQLATARAVFTARTAAAPASP
jgi:hypothetical protein